MDRRKFLSGLAAVVGGIALEQAIPNGRVWSFPTNIKIRPNEEIIKPMILKIKYVIAPTELSNGWKTYNIVGKTLTAEDVNSPSFGIWTP